MIELLIEGEEVKLFIVAGNFVVQVIFLGGGGQCSLGLAGEFHRESLQGDHRVDIDPFGFDGGHGAVHVLVLPAGTGKRPGEYQAKNSPFSAVFTHKSFIGILLYFFKGMWQSGV